MLSDAEFSHRLDVVLAPFSKAFRYATPRRGRTLELTSSLNDSQIAVTSLPHRVTLLTTADAPDALEQESAQCALEALREIARMECESRLDGLPSWLARARKGIQMGEECLSVLSSLSDCLSSMLDVTDAVQEQSNLLSSNASALMVRKTKLEMVQEEIQRIIKHFTRIEVLIHEAEQPSLSATSPRYPGMLQEIEDEMQFLSSNSQFLSSKTYTTKLVGAQHRAFQCLKGAIVVSLQSAQSVVVNAEVYQSVLNQKRNKSLDASTNIENAEAFSQSLSMTDESLEAQKIAMEVLGSINTIFVKKLDEKASLRRMIEARSGELKLHDDIDEVEFLDFYREIRVAILGPLLQSWLEVWGDCGNGSKRLPELVSYIASLMKVILLREKELFDEVWLREDFSARFFPQILSEIANDVYHVFRSHLLRVDELEELAQVIEEIQRVNSKQDDVAELGGLFTKMVQDAQERFIFRTSVFLRHSIADGSATKAMLPQFLCEGTEVVCDRYIPAVTYCVSLLRLLYPSLDFSSFSVFAEEAIHCALSQIQEFAKLMSQQSGEHSMLKGLMYQLRHLLHLHEELSCINENITVVEKCIDLTGIAHRRLAIVQSSRECKKDVESEIKSCCDHMIQVLFTEISSPLSGAVRKKKEEVQTAIHAVEQNWMNQTALLTAFIPDTSTREALLRSVRIRLDELLRETASIHGQPRFDIANKERTENTEEYTKIDESLADALVLKAFLALPECTNISAEFEKLKCSTTTFFHTYPCSTDTDLEHAVLNLLQTESSLPVIPIQLLWLLIQRLGMACTMFTGLELACFLRVSLPCISKLAQMIRETSSEVMVDVEAEKYLLLVLQLLRSKLVNQIAPGMLAMSLSPRSENVAVQVVDESRIVIKQCPMGNDENISSSSFFSRDFVMCCLRNALQLLKSLYVEISPSAKNTTDFSAEQCGAILLCGFSKSSTSTTVSLIPPKRFYQVENKDLTTSGTDLSSTRQAIILECGILFEHFSKGTLDLNIPEEEEQQILSEALCSLALLFHYMCYEPCKQIVSAILAGTGVQLARLCAAKKEMEVKFLFHQLSNSLHLVAGFLKGTPQLTVSAMNAVCFLDNLVGALQVVGMQYACDQNDEKKNAEIHKCMMELISVADLKTFSNNKISDCLQCFSSTGLDRLASDDDADAFLHSYLTLLEAQRHVQNQIDVQSQCIDARYLMEVELTIIKVFLIAPNRFFSKSCMYMTLAKHMINTLSVSDMFVPGELYIKNIRVLINAGLYTVLFHKNHSISFYEVPHLLYVAVYVLHCMLFNPTVSVEFGVEEEISAILRVIFRCCKEDLPQEEVKVSSCFCALVVSALHGPNCRLVVAAILQENGVSILTEMIRNLILFKVREGKETEIGDWLLYLMKQLLEVPDVQEVVLMTQAETILSLLTEKRIRSDVEEIFVSLLSHRAAVTQYSRRMEVLVKRTRELLIQSAEMQTEGPPLVIPLELDELDHLLLSILRCICISLRALSADTYSWGPVRQLQNLLCDDTNSTPDLFLLLLHRAVLPWRGVKVSDGLSSIFRTITLLVQGNPALRARLFQTMSANQLVGSLKEAWFASHGGSWFEFVYSVLSLVYEEDTDMRHHLSKLSKMHTTAALESHTEDEGTVIQNSELLPPLLSIFTELDEFQKKHRDALQYLLSRVLRTLKTSRVSLWMVANAGLFGPLTDLITVVTGTALLETVLTLIMTITSHHISVRETKQLLVSIAHLQTEERERLVPIVIEVLNHASYVFLNRNNEWKNYIAFRERSGLSGIRAALSSFPSDGYTVCLWIRLENRADSSTPQCIFSLQSVELQTVLKLVTSTSGLSVAFLDAQKQFVELDLDCNITPETWIHLAVVHRQATFPFGSNEFLLFLNAEEVVTFTCVQYPLLSSGFFNIGICGEDVERCSSNGCFTGQMTAVYFINRPLQVKEVRSSFSITGGNSNEKQMNASIAVYVDPRFGECGQLHNLAALLRGRHSDQPLITYEGTIACNTTSIIDSICVLGALQTVVIPLLLLLVNPQLPFQYRIPASRRKTVTEQTRKSVDELFKLVESLLVSNIVRADIKKIGFFPIISHVLQQFVAYECPNLPQRLCNLCSTLLTHDDIFDAAYTAIFLSGDFLHACGERTQLMLIRSQYTFFVMDNNMRQRLRELGLPTFIASEVAHVYNTLSLHHQTMRLELFCLMDEIMIDPITMNDAEALLCILIAAIEQGISVILLETLERIRMLITRKSLFLAAYMGKKNFAAHLILLLNTNDNAVQNEVLLLFCLLVSRSRRTQMLLNSTLLTEPDAVHVECDVSLSWLKDKLQTVVVDDALYSTFRTALTGRFDVSLKEHLELREDDKILFAPILTPLLQLMKQCQDKTMKCKAMHELATLIKQDTLAWKSMVSVPGWYVSIAELYLSEDEIRDEHATGNPYFFLSATSTIFAKVIFQALLQESYGASELELLVAYLAQQRAHILLNAVLVNVVAEYVELLSNRRSFIVSSNLGLGSSQAAANLKVLLLVVEDVLFYSSTTYQVYGATRRSEPLLRRSYAEEAELVLCNTGRVWQQREEQSTSPPSSQELQEQEQEQLNQQQRQETPRNRLENELFFPRDTTSIHIVPDGLWLHMTLALHTMELITSQSSLLNSGGTSGSSGQELFPRGRQLRKGGFLRFFVRLFRVACQFTLYDTCQIKQILFLTSRWVQLIESEQGIFLLPRRQVTEPKEHTPLSGSMIMILSLHELLDRYRWNKGMYGRR